MFSALDLRVFDDERSIFRRNCAVQDLRTFDNKRARFGRKSRVLLILTTNAFSACNVVGPFLDIF